MAHTQAPDEATQEAEYRKVLDGLAGRPLVVRTLDVGGDKPLPYWPIAKEENPFLGVRGIRLTLQRPTIMDVPMRASFRNRKIVVSGRSGSVRVDLGDHRIYTKKKITRYS